VFPHVRQVLPTFYTGPYLLNGGRRLHFALAGHCMFTYRKMALPVVAYATHGGNGRTLLFIRSLWGIQLLKKKNCSCIILIQLPFRIRDHYTLWLIEKLKIKRYFVLRLWLKLHCHAAPVPTPAPQHFLS
jgi:hypothetical protein